MDEGARDVRWRLLPTCIHPRPIGRRPMSLYGSVGGALVQSSFGISPARLVGTQQGASSLSIVPSGPLVGLSNNVELLRSHLEGVLHSHVGDDASAASVTAASMLRSLQNSFPTTYVPGSLVCDLAADDIVRDKRRRQYDPIDGSLLAHFYDANGVPCIAHAGGPQGNAFGVDGSPLSIHPSDSINVGQPIRGIAVSAAATDAHGVARTDYACHFFPLDCDATGESDRRDGRAVRRVNFEDVICCTSMGHQLGDECVIVTERGRTYTWSVSAGTRLVYDPPSSETDATTWRSVHFGANPQTIVCGVAKELSLLDIGSHARVTLARADGSNLIFGNGQLYACAAHPRNPLLTAACGETSLFLVDQRMPNRPLLNWTHEVDGHPTFLSCGRLGTEDYALLGCKDTRESVLFRYSSSPLPAHDTPLVYIDGRPVSYDVSAFARPGPTLGPSLPRRMCVYADAAFDGVSRVPMPLSGVALVFASARDEARQWELSPGDVRMEQERRRRSRGASRNDDSDVCPAFAFLSCSVAGDVYGQRYSTGGATDSPGVLREGCAAAAPIYEGLYGRMGVREGDYVSRAQLASCKRVDIRAACRHLIAESDEADPFESSDKVEISSQAMDALCSHIIGAVHTKWRSFTLFELCRDMIEAFSDEHITPRDVLAAVKRLCSDANPLITCHAARPIAGLRQSDHVTVAPPLLSRDADGVSGLPRSEDDGDRLHAARDAVRQCLEDAEAWIGNVRILGAGGGGKRSRFANTRRAAAAGVSAASVIVAPVALTAPALKGACSNPMAPFERILDTWVDGQRARPGEDDNWDGRTTAANADKTGEDVDPVPTREHPAMYLLHMWRRGGGSDGVAATDPSTVPVGPPARVGARAEAASKAPKRELAAAVKPKKVLVVPSVAAVGDSPARAKSRVTFSFEDDDAHGHGDDAYKAVTTRPTQLSNTSGALHATTTRTAGATNKTVAGAVPDPNSHESVDSDDWPRTPTRPPPLAIAIAATPPPAIASTRPPPESPSVRVGAVGMGATIVPDLKRASTGKDKGKTVKKPRISGF